MAEALELILRLSSAVMLTLASVYLGVSLIRKVIKPLFVWFYLGAVLSGLAIVRWTFLFIALNWIPDPPEADFLTWQASINQTLYVLLGVSVILLITPTLLGCGATIGRMVMSEWALVISVLVAILGSIGGFAALMKVNADNSKTISEGATNVVDLLSAQSERQQLEIDKNTKRLDALEGYASRFDDWADKISSLLNRSIELMPEPPRESFRQEATDVHKARPRRRVADERKNAREPTA